MAPERPATPEVDPQADLPTQIQSLLKSEFQKVKADLTAAVHTCTKDSLLHEFGTRLEGIQSSVNALLEHKGRSVLVERLVIILVSAALSGGGVWGIFVRPAKAPTQDVTYTQPANPATIPASVSSPRTATTTTLPLSASTSGAVAHP